MNTLFYQYNLNSDCISFQSKTNKNNDFELNTINKLYTDEYYIKPKKNKAGYYRTTVINKKTNKPKIIYIKYIKNNEDNLCYERYGFYERNVFGKYKQIGKRSFGIDKNEKLVTSGSMRSDFNDKYAGIGIRGHQLAVERMLQEGFNNVYIFSVPEAFPFHYKCGFRPINEQLNSPERFYNANINEVIKHYAKNWNVPEYIIKNNIEYEQRGEDIYVKDYILIGKIGEAMLLNNMEVPDEVYVDMKLSDKALEKWEQRAKSQPILLEEE